MSDDQLLRAFVTTGDGPAMAELSRRYAPIVYAAARRQTRDSAMAEDVCQCVFVAFARRAASVRSAASLGAWLLQTTRFTAANAMKIESRRRRHEQSAAQMRSEISPDSDPAGRLAGNERKENWDTISPILDRAMSRLGWADRTALVLRFFRGLSLGELAAAIGTSEEAARKRVRRATQRLGKALSANGVSATTFTAADLPVLLRSHAVEPAPAHVLARIKTAAAPTVSLAVPALSGFKLFAGGIAAVAAVVVVVAIGAGPTGRPQQISPDAVALASTQPMDATQPSEADWQAKFRQVYSLDDGHYFKNVPPPFIPERQKFFSSVAPRMADTNPDANQLLIVQRIDGSFGFTGFGRIAGTAGGPIAVAARLAQLKPGQVQGDPGLLHTPLAGDWVVRGRATPDQIMHGVAESVSAQIGKEVVVSRALADLDVVVVHGSVRRPQDKREQPTIRINLGNDVNAARGGGLGSVGGLLNRLSQATGVNFINETAAADPARPAIRFEMIGSIGNGERIGDQALKDLLKSLADQTALTFVRDVRPLPVWTLKLRTDK